MRAEAGTAVSPSLFRHSGVAIIVILIKESICAHYLRDQFVCSYIWALREDGFFLGKQNR